MKAPWIVFILLQIGTLLPLKTLAVDDQDLADRLKQDLLHEGNRRKAFKEYEEEKKRADKEQNKGLALWLEEQEQWDLAREKSVSEYKRNQRATPEEGSKEYFADLAEKERAQRVIEEARKQHIQVKKNILAQYQVQDAVAEEEELGIYNQRPRYDLRKRGTNKWTKSGSSMGSGAGSSGSSSGGYNSGGGYQGGDNYDFPPPPPPDFGNVPQDSFDDFPPPPPPPGDFGNAPGTYDSGFGDAPMPPPPPPPPEGGWDF